MAPISYQTRPGESAATLPKVYLACHPEEDALSFAQIADQLLAAANCAVLPYITAENNLVEGKLLVYAVTRRLLTSAVDQLQHTLAAAEKLSIPVLPILQEEGLFPLAHQVLGSRYLLDVTDRRRISAPYANKLKKFLQTVLASDDSIEQYRLAQLYAEGIGFPRDPQTAIRLYQEAIPLLRKRYEEIKTEEVATAYLEALCKLANTQDSILLHDQAQETFRNYHTEAQRLADEVGHPNVRLHLAQSYQELANVAYAIPNYPEAKAHCNSVIPIAECLAKEADSEKAKRVLISANEKLSYIFNNEGDLAEAEHYLQIALALAQSLAEETPNEHNRRSVANLRRDLGALYKKRKEYGKAIESVQRAVETDTKLLTASEEEYNTRLSLSSAYAELGLVQKASGDLPAATASLLQAVELRAALMEEYDSITIRSSYAYICNQLGNAYSDAEKHSDARHYHQTAYELREALLQFCDTPDTRRNCANTAGYLVNDYYAVADYTKAIEYNRRAIELKESLVQTAPTLSSKRNLAVSYDDMGLTYQKKGEFAAAREYFLKAIKLTEAMVQESSTASTKRNLVRSYNRMATLCKEERNTDERIWYLEKRLSVNLALYRETSSANERRKVANDHSILGDLYREQGSYDQAIRHFQKYLSLVTDIFRENENLDTRRELALANHQLGRTYNFATDIPEAEKYMQTALSIFKGIEKETGSTQAKHDLANSYSILGYLSQLAEEAYNAQIRFRAAAKYYEATVSDNETEQTLCDLAQCYTNLGNTENWLGNVDLARQYHHKAIALARKVEEQSNSLRAGITLRDSHHALGQSGIAENDPQSALQVLPQAVRYGEIVAEKTRTIEDRRQLAGALINTARASLLAGLPEEAVEAEERGITLLEALLREADHMPARFNLAEAYDLLGDAHLTTGNRAAAKAYYEQATEIFRQIPDENALIEVLLIKAENDRSLGDLYREEGSLNRALEYYRASHDRICKVAETQHTVNVFNKLAASYLRLGTCLKQRTLLKVALEIWRNHAKQFPKDKSYRTNIKLVKKELRRVFWQNLFGRGD